MLSYMRLAQAEASQRLFGAEKESSDAKYEGNMALIRGILDAVLYILTIPPLMALMYRTWTKRHKYKAKLVKVGSRMVKKFSKVASFRRPRHRREAESDEGAGGDAEVGGVELAAVSPEAVREEKEGLGVRRGVWRAPQAPQQ